MRIKMNTTIIYFKNNIHIEINLIKNSFKRAVVHYKCYISIDLIKQVNKTSASKECDFCHYWYFLKV